MRPADKQASSTKKCFSYIRYSSIKQAQGSSEDRQMEIAPRVADDKGWVLDHSLNVKNLGLSAYTGSNVQFIEGIIEAGGSGKIPSGTVLILEALDRLTRIPLDDAYQLFRRILLSGIEIYTDRSSRHLTKSDLNNPMSVMMTVVELDAGNQYSEKLAYRMSSAWLKKREALKEGKRLTKMCVAWIDPQTWKPIKERADVVRSIFRMYESGIGISSIVRKLNNNGVALIGRGKGWHSSYVSNILKNRAVIGEFQTHKTTRIQGQRHYNRTPAGDPIENYYPAIIDRATFFSVQEKLGRSHKKLRTDKVVNLFAGVARCACGERMYLANPHKGNRKYYYCWSRIKGNDCGRPALNYDAWEYLFILTVMENLDAIYGTNDAQAKELAAMKGEVRELRRQIDNITNLVVDGKATKALVERQATLESKLQELRGRIEIADAKPQKVDRETIRSVDFSQIQGNANVRRKVRDFILSHMESMVFDGLNGVKFNFNNPKASTALQRTIDRLRKEHDIQLFAKANTKTS
jgi:DNA invertase Pin-like site-specific DNA recombinase